MGDDTWMQLAQHAFTEAYPYPSFNVHDLHTVDDGVWEVSHLMSHSVGPIFSSIVSRHSTINTTYSGAPTVLSRGQAFML